MAIWFGISGLLGFHVYLVLTGSGDEGRWVGWTWAATFPTLPPHPSSFIFLSLCLWLSGTIDLLDHHTRSAEARSLGLQW